jgi:hypothetical protein
MFDGCRFAIGIRVLRAWKAPRDGLDLVLKGKISVYLTTVV